jgi:hypothetical protein
MKKIFILLLSLLLTTSGFAQFTFGPKVALNFAELSPNIAELASARNPGFEVGLFFRAGRRFYIQPELLYAFKSANLEENFSQVITKNTKISSIDLPVLLGFKIINVNLLNLRIFAGPHFAFTVKNNFADTYKSAGFNFAGLMGVGVDVVKFTVDFRYDYFINASAKHASGGRLRFNVFQVSIGWKFF